MLFGYNLKYKLYNICKHPKNQDELISMFLDFTAQLVHPKSPEHYRNIVYQHEDINVDDVWFALHYNRHTLPTSTPTSTSPSPSPPPPPTSSPRNDQILIENMKKSLEMIRLMNIIFKRVYEMKNETFDLFQPDHLLLLNELWNNLKPDRPRINSDTQEINNNIISPEWTEIGFQGSDPTTDFRGMGILGLTQLYYFSRNRNQAARMILQVFTQDKQRYYPFAIIGINITRFLLDLISELRIQKLLIENLGHVFAASLQSYQILPSNDPICIEFGMNLINDVYCIIFEEFYLQWVIANPVNIMSFNTIFDQVKLSIRNKYESLINS